MDNLWIIYRYFWDKPQLRTPCQGNEVEHDLSGVGKTCLNLPYHKSHIDKVRYTFRDLTANQYQPILLSM